MCVEAVTLHCAHPFSIKQNKQQCKVAFKPSLLIKSQWNSANTNCWCEHDDNVMEDKIQIPLLFLPWSCMYYLCGTSMMLCLMGASMQASHGWDSNKKKNTSYEYIVTEAIHLPKKKESTLSSFQGANHNRFDIVPENYNQMHVILSSGTRRLWRKMEE